MFSGFGQIPGVWFDADIELEPLEQVFASAPIIAVSFPAFTDGSGFSTGSLIREVFGYKGELRAFGSLLSDQLGYLRRCGYDSVALPEDQDMETGRQQFHAEMVSYQGIFCSHLRLSGAGFARQKAERARQRIAVFLFILACKDICLILYAHKINCLD
ncbi:DUF934 domain-containing protein [Aliamphritea spongicola]|nr:DUF934 domain-containing protein [Aliamphritea spongicola]